MTTIAIFLYDAMTALDAIGPYEVLARVPGAKIQFVAKERGAVRVDTRALSLLAEHTIDEVPTPDVLLLPGGSMGTAAVLQDQAVLDWVRRAHETSTFTTSVCSGSLILAAAGVLAERRATTHFMAMSLLEGFGAKPIADRVVTDGKIITAAGVSAGIDMGLTLAAKLSSETHARAIQLLIEYDPKPPFAPLLAAEAPRDVLQALEAIISAEQP